MIESNSPIYQTLLGTLFTWGMTAAGAGLVVFISGTQVIINIYKAFCIILISYCRNYLKKP